MPIFTGYYLSYLATFKATSGGIDQVFSGQQREETKVHAYLLAKFHDTVPHTRLLIHSESEHGGRRDVHKVKLGPKSGRLLVYDHLGVTGVWPLWAVRVQQLHLNAKRYEIGQGNNLKAKNEADNQLSRIPQTQPESGC
jgi:hypothetical protein